MLTHGRHWASIRPLLGSVSFCPSSAPSASLLRLHTLGGSRGRAKDVGFCQPTWEASPGPGSCLWSGQALAAVDLEGGVEWTSRWKIFLCPCVCFQMGISENIFKKLVLVAGAVAEQLNPPSSSTSNPYDC